ncbi:MAG TPA: MFS transporter, partial [Bacteroidales bacterium]|nr:MFS transporter [Bacteroidales bacterium]
MLFFKKKIKWIPLFATNFFGVLNDNILKNLICFVSIYWVANSKASIVIMLATGVMVLPYILFSPLAGKFAKIRSKQKIVFWTKLSEIPIMLFAWMGFYFENIYIVIAGMFLMGLQSTVYSPSKYGLIREIGGTKGISFGTGTIEMLTFLGVLLGTFFAGVLSDIKTHRLFFILLAIMTITLSGFFAAVKLKANETKPLSGKMDSVNPIKFIIRMIKSSEKKYQGLNLTVFGLSSFWLIGSLIQMNLLVHCPQTLQMTNTATGFVMALVAIAVATGSFLSGIFSKKKVEVGLIPVGSFGLAISISMIVLINPGKILFIILMISAAFFAGFFKIPLNAWIQDKVQGRNLGDAIAYNNLMNFIFILIS